MEIREFLRNSLTLRVERPNGHNPVDFTALRPGDLFTFKKITHHVLVALPRGEKGSQRNGNDAPPLPWPVIVVQTSGIKAYDDDIEAKNGLPPYKRHATSVVALLDTGRSRQYPYKHPLSNN